MNSEKFCLRWNDFEGNISAAFRELRDDKDFFDVTLACDDEQIQAHKVILSACSPFFRNILRRNPHQHPLLYMKSVKYTDLQAVLNFMYHGEVNVAQEELNSFLAVAEDLKVKGLTQNNSESHDTKASSSYKSSKEKTPARTFQRPPDREPPLKRSRPAPHVLQPQEDDIQEVVPIKSEPRDNTTDQSNTTTTTLVYNHPQPVALAEDSLTPYQEEEVVYEEYGQYDEQYGQQMDMSMGQTQVTEAGKGGNFQSPEELLQYVAKSVEGSIFECTLCSNFKAVRKGLVRNHLESIHFPGLFSYTCERCNKEFQGRNALAVHKSKKLNCFYTE